MPAPAKNTQSGRVKTLQFAVECKADDGKKTIEGYASVFGVRDFHNEEIPAGAYDETIKAKPDGVPFLWQHWTDNIIGKVDHLKSDNYGLEFRSRMTDATQLAREAMGLAVDKMIDGISVGIDVLEDSWVEPPAGSGLRGFRKLTKIDLWEISLVTFPANTHARVTAVSKLWLPAYLKHNKGSAEGHGIAHIVNSILTEATGNRAELELSMMNEAGIDQVELGAILSLTTKCPAEGVVRGLARGLGLEEQMLLDAGNAAGCSYAAAPKHFVFGGSKDMVRKGALSNRLNDRLEAMIDDDTTREDVVSMLSSASGISEGTVNEILRGEIECPPLNRLSAFARVLGVSAGSLRTAAESDGCSYTENSGICMVGDKKGRMMSKDEKVEKANLLLSSALNKNTRIPEAADLPEEIGQQTSQLNEGIKAFGDWLDTKGEQ